MVQQITSLSSLHQTHTYMEALHNTYVLNPFPTGVMVLSRRGFSTNKNYAPTPKPYFRGEKQAVTVVSLQRIFVGFGSLHF